jgi:hypothetical protein
MLLIACWSCAVFVFVGQSDPIEICPPGFDDEDCNLSVSGSGTEEPTTGSPSVKIITSGTPQTTEPSFTEEPECNEDDEDCDRDSSTGSGEEPVRFDKGDNILYRPVSKELPDPLNLDLTFASRQSSACLLYFRINAKEGLLVSLSEGRVTLTYYPNIKRRARRQANEDGSVFLTERVNDGNFHSIKSTIDGSKVTTSVDDDEETSVEFEFTLLATYQSVIVGISDVPGMPGFAGQMETVKIGEVDILDEARAGNPNIEVTGINFGYDVTTPSEQTTTKPTDRITTQSKTPSVEATTTTEASSTSKASHGTFIVETTAPTPTSTEDDINLPVDDSDSSGISGGLVAGVVLGVVIAVLVVTAILVFVIMRYQRRDEGSYTLDEESPAKNGFPNSTKAQEAGVSSQEWYM